MSRITEETIALEYQRAREGADIFMKSVVERFAHDGVSNEVAWGRIMLSMQAGLALSKRQQRILYTATYLGLQLHNLRQGREG